MITVDTSVLVAAFCTWHELHEEANRIVKRGTPLVAQCATECFSVLTRLPSPQRIAPADAARWLDERFSQPWLCLSPEAYADIVARAPRLGIIGGAIYDGIVAETARQACLTLRSFDGRATATYRAVGVQLDS